MTHSRRIIAPFVVLALLCALGLTALPLRAQAASSDEKLAMAQTLNSIGLFKGYDESGNNFGLTDIPTREQALYSDVTSSNPVTAWSVPYAAYATDKVSTVWRKANSATVSPPRHRCFPPLSGKNFLLSDILPVLCGWVTK